MSVGQWAALVECLLHRPTNTAYVRRYVRIEQLTLFMTGLTNFDGIGSDLFHGLH